MTTYDTCSCAAFTSPHVRGLVNDAGQRCKAVTRTTVRRLLVTGSRTWTDVQKLGSVLLDARHELSDSKRGDDVLLVHGACPSGADAIADALWTTIGGEVERHPADWKRHGKSAGHKRNAHMVELGADLCLAFIKDNSPGASGCAQLARLAGIEVRPYT